VSRAAQNQTAMMYRVIRIMVVGAMVALCALSVSDSALAQCAMCRAGVTQAFAKNLNLAIVVLFVPPVTMFVAIFFVAFRNRKG
jgi:hypothetical protein